MRGKIQKDVVKTEQNRQRPSEAGETEGHSR
jgi:hypothetical protein